MCQAPSQLYCIRTGLFIRFPIIFLISFWFENHYSKSYYHGIGTHYFIFMLKSSCLAFRFHNPYYDLNSNNSLFLVSQKDIFDPYTLLYKTETRKPQQVAIWYSVTDYGSRRLLLTTLFSTWICMLKFG
jgi:hypothetical protein